MSDRTILVTIDSNRKTCGECAFLRRDHLGTHLEWWCEMFRETRGIVGAMKTPNRSNACLRAEQEASDV